MRKYRFLILLLIMILGIFAVIPLETARTDNSRWMASLSEDTRIRSLSIPGTHDSGALYSIADVAGKCQSLPIGEQLQLGVRFLDIRLQLRNNKLHIVHSFVDQKTTFEDALQKMVHFIEENPSEFLILSIKEDAAPKNSSQAYAQVVQAYLSKYDSIIRNDRSLPDTLGEARGHIYILSRYETESGIPAYNGWLDSTSFSLNDLYIQDHYAIENTDDKQKDIEQAFTAAASGSYDLVLNFTSCYLTSGFPPAYAATPARDINPWLLERIPQIDGPLGVLICDYMTSELASVIIERNFS